MATSQIALSHRAFSLRLVFLLNVSKLILGIDMSLCASINELSILSVYCLPLNNNNNHSHCLGTDQKIKIRTISLWFSHKRATDCALQHTLSFDSRRRLVQQEHSRPPSDMEIWKIWIYSKSNTIEKWQKKVVNICKCRYVATRKGRK